MSRKSVLAIALAIGCLGAAGGAAVNIAGGAVLQCCKGGPLYGVLNGQKEVAPDGRKRAGDPDGKGSASAIYDEGKLCYGLTVKNIGNPLGAHIHRGRRGKNGRIVVRLDPPSKGDPGASSGCVKVSERLARSIIENPDSFYWNVHTSEYPNGAIRGQVFAKTK
ncbi:MAG: CHRD domain-containing protein [Actinobacteria bacterium]|nr:CHRD domain-containing protein [Actinomycetota bacterium]